MFRFTINPNDFHLPNREPETEPWSWGKLELMGGEVELKFAPITGMDRIGLGPNYASKDEIKKVVDDIPISDLRRTVRTILR